jgi:hypothetical protein
MEQEHFISNYLTGNKEMLIHSSLDSPVSVDIYAPERGPSRKASAKVASGDPRPGQ